MRRAASARRLFKRESSCCDQRGETIQCLTDSGHDSGHLLFVFNNSFDDRTPLTAAISTDNGKTFPHRRNLATGDGDFAYPTAIQTTDGQIHVTYTSDERTVVRHAVFSEEAIFAPSRNN